MSARRPVRPRLTIGFTYNEKRIKPGLDGARDDEAEFDGPATLDAIRGALRGLGHDVVDLEADDALPAKLLKARPDLVFNIAEGRHGRGREAQVPALLDLLGIPYTGSDPATMALCLDKGWAKAVVEKAGVAVPWGAVLRDERGSLPAKLPLPAIVKPLLEGSSKGIFGRSTATSRAQATKLARALVRRYGQPALVEAYVTGREVTVGVLGPTDAPEALPPMEVVFLGDEPLPVYAFEHKQEAHPGVRYEAPAKLSKALTRRVQRAAELAYSALGCRDVARIDFRLTADGTPVFLECNPLPGLTPGWSDLVLSARAAALDYEALVGRIVGHARSRAGC